MPSCPSGDRYFPQDNPKCSSYSKSTDLFSKRSPIYPYRGWYSKHHRKILYLNLLTSGKLNGYLADLDKQAEDMFSRLVKQMAECEGVTEQLKADNQSAWVGRMNNICQRTAELVNTDFIYG
ncbi:MAG: TnpV protein [Ruminococcaceae bacterium]|nr:TnpV protein [Oscillospiraceae bacterium]